MVQGMVQGLDQATSPGAAHAFRNASSFWISPSSGNFFSLSLEKRSLPFTVTSKHPPSPGTRRNEVIFCL